MTSLDEMGQRSAAATFGSRFAVELTETLKLAVPIALTQLGQIAMIATDLALIGPPWRRRRRRGGRWRTPVYFIGITFEWG